MKFILTLSLANTKSGAHAVADSLCSAPLLNRVRYTGTLGEKSFRLMVPVVDECVCVCMIEWVYQ
jgi:hypothetical protein